MGMRVETRLAYTKGHLGGLDRAGLAEQPFKVLQLLGTGTGKITPLHFVG
ncbi:MAG: hypothetical protein ABWU16_03100 [Halothiobacillaceae bacterium]